MLRVHSNIGQIICEFYLFLHESNFPTIIILENVSKYSYSNKLFESDSQIDKNWYIKLYNKLSVHWMIKNEIFFSITILRFQKLSSLFTNIITIHYLYRLSSKPGNLENGDIIFLCQIISHLRKTRIPQCNWLYPYIKLYEVDRAIW